MHTNVLWEVIWVYSNVLYGLCNMVVQACHMWCGVTPITILRSYMLLFVLTYYLFLHKFILCLFFDICSYKILKKTGGFSLMHQLSETSQNVHVACDVTISIPKNDLCVMHHPLSPPVLGSRSIFSGCKGLLYRTPFVLAKSNPDPYLWNPHPHRYRLKPNQ